MSEQAAAERIYAAMRRLVLESDDRKQQVVDALGMSFSRGRALRALAVEPIRMSELATRLVADKPFTTVVVDDLEQRGLVVREQDPDDRRCKIVRITPAGREAAETATRILSAPPTELAALSPTDLETLDLILAKLRS